MNSNSVHYKYTIYTWESLYSDFQDVGFYGPRKTLSGLKKKMWQTDVQTND
jgi:hypothetical protein